ncbi:MAG: DEAD/DEAH box helicase [Planctomycetota bacterium]|nr:DEAD/DEAH box helicase [Planctomycetota bacterium]
MSDTDTPTTQSGSTSHFDHPAPSPDAAHDDPGALSAGLGADARPQDSGDDPQVDARLDDARSDDAGADQLLTSASGETAPGELGSGELGSGELGSGELGSGELGSAGAKPVGEIFEDVTFESLGLRNSVLKGVTAAGFQRPTAIQARLIPVILTGKDVLGQARTGTGKTAAFGLPLLHQCQRDIPFQALVLAPTRELAIQITTELEELGEFTPIRSTTVYGGDSVRGQAEKLKRGSQIIVGTPGRVMDMVERGNLHFRNIKHVVLDEVDRMLDIGFRDDIRRILEMCPPKEQRQTIVVSATLSDEIEKLARKYMRDPEKIVTTAGSLTVSLVKQYYLTVNPWDKKRLLLHLLRHEEPALTVVFCRLKRLVDEIATGLTKRGIDAHAIHGDMPQGRRNRTMQRLRGGELSVLVASDLASRGLDVDDISHVINFDLPEDPEVYVHRIGRTARAGREGVAWSFVAPDQGGLLTDIEMLINTEVPKLDYPDFKPTDAPPRGWRDPNNRPMGGLMLAEPVRPAARPEARPDRSRFAPPSLPVAGGRGAVASEPAVQDIQASSAAGEATGYAGPVGGAPSSAGVGGPAHHPADAGHAPEGTVTGRHAGASASPTQAVGQPAAQAAAGSNDLDPSKFPMGMIPTKLPPKMLQGRVKKRGR